MTVASDMVTTCLGELHVEVHGEGLPAVFWHSLFVDSATWVHMRPLLAAHRRLILIDGPAHGKSAMPPAGFAFDACASAALEVLDALGVHGPVDWVGNAWGGHVGLLLGARSPERIRSLVTIGTPTHALTTGERMKIIPMIWAYRFVGAPPPLAGAVARTLLGPEFVRSRHDDTELVVRTIRDTPREGLLRAMESVMLRRPDLGHLLPRVAVPAVMVAPAADPMLSVGQVRAAAARLPRGRAVEIPGEGHVGPIMAQAQPLASLISEFWRDPAGYVSR